MPQKYSTKQRTRSAEIQRLEDAVAVITPLKVQQQKPQARDEHGGFVKGVIVGDFSARYSYGFVPTEELLVDRTYQRELESKRVTYMARNWDQDLAGELVVSLRDNGKFYVIDGQHRHGSVQLMSNPPSQMFCRIYTGLTVADEARLFRDLDTKRRGLTTGAAFKAALAAGEQFAVDISAAAAAAGMTAEYGRKAPGNIRAFKTVADIHRRRGSEFLTRVLSIVNKAWPDNQNAANSSVLYGLEVLLVKFPFADDARLTQILRERDPAWVETQGRIMNGTLSSAIASAVAFVIYQLYNKGMRSRKLPDWKW